MRFTFSLRFIALLIFSAHLLKAAQESHHSNRPNIIVIMTDDMGFSDLGFMGSEISTPNLDGLAKNGVVFNQFYNTARCCPTRASLLTGLYPHQAGIGHMMNDRGHDGYRGELNKNSVTMAEVLRPAGYRTYAIGKWHVTKHTNAKTQEEKFNWPLQRGFDRFYGTLSGAGNYWDPNNLARDNELISPFSDKEYQPQGPYYYTDAIADNTVKFLREHQGQHKERPFFMYVTFTAAHWPMQAHEEDIAKYKGKYSTGYQTIRDRRYEKMTKQGIVSSDSTTLTKIEGGLENTKDWEWDQRNMEVYAAMVDRMDQGVGKIIAELKAQGLLENTLICFLQDNGACAEDVGRQGRGKVRADAPSLQVIPKDAIRGDYPPKQTREGYPVRSGKGVWAGPSDTWVAYGEAWATVSNTPFREYKHWVHEGGISTPLIVHWPKAIAAEKKGSVSEEPGHLIDIMATCVDVGKADYPTQKDGHTIKPHQGRSFASLLAPLEKPLPTRNLFWEHEGNRAVREGKWKLVAKENQPWELYDISQDRSELKNLAANFPEVVKDLEKKWNDYAAKSDVLPLGTWRGKTRSVSSNNEFLLKEGDKLEGAKVPDIENRDITIETQLDYQGTENGVVVAQGGSRYGYSLFIDDGKLSLIARVEGTIHSVNLPIQKGFLQIKAKIKPKMGLELTAGEARETRLIRFELKQPADGLQLGDDEGGKVGEYSKPAKYTGKINSVKILLSPKFL